MIPIFPCDSRRSKGMPSGSGDFLRLLVGSCMGPSNLPKFSPMANGYIHIECNCTARQIWTKDRAILRMDVLSHQISSPPTPKITQNPIFGDLSWLSIQSLYTRSTPYKSDVNGAMKLKLYSYRYRQVLGGMGCVKILPLGDVRGAQGPLMQIWEPLYYLGKYWS